jgi:phage terminase large subunit-like protein
VLSGKVVACKALVQAVERYQSDMAKAGEDCFPFQFDYETADFYCNLFPLIFRHSKGAFAGTEFRLQPWQLFIVWQLFGWKRNDGTRRFRRLFKTVARKNGKSTFAAALVLILTFLDGEAGAEIYIGATKLDQAKIIHDEAERMVRKSPSLMKQANILKNNISFRANNSFARPLGSDKPYDGLNPHGVIFDEMHAWKEHHRGYYDTLTTGSAAREQPMQVTISTKGDDNSLIFNEELEYSRGVLDGWITDDGLLVSIFEMDPDDDLLDPSKWLKSNPNLGVSVSLEYLEGQANEAKHKSTGLNRFERYHGNRTVTSVDSPIDIELWDSLAGVLSDPREADRIGMGVDLGGRDDLASYSVCMSFDHGIRRPQLVDGSCPRCRRSFEGEDECQVCESVTYRYEGWTRSFIAEDTKRDLSKEPFATWIHEGKLTVCQYVMTELREALVEDAQSLGVQFICFDPYQAQSLSEELQREGMKPVKMPQNHAHFTEPIEEFLSAMAEERFKPDQNDPVFRWAATNMSLRTNPQGGVMPDKPKSKEKIDPMVAYLMAQRASTFDRGRGIDPKSLYVS